MARLKDVCWWATATVLTSAVTLHFALVLLYVLPDNPISYDANPSIEAYIRPLFAQNWRLFAPIPLSRNLDGYARGGYVDGAEVHFTPWVPFTRPLVEAVQANRITPLAAPTTDLLKAMGDLNNRLAGVDPESEEFQSIVRAWADPSQAPAALVVLQLAGCSALADAYPEVTFQEVQLMVTVHEFPRFTERASAGDSGPLASMVFRPAAFRPVARIVRPW